MRPPAKHAYAKAHHAHHESIKALGGKRCGVCGEELS